MNALGAVFGLTVRVAESAEEWAELLALAREAGGVDIGDATRNDYQIVIDQRHGMVICSTDEVFKRLVAAIPTVDGKPC